MGKNYDLTREIGKLLFFKILDRYYLFGTESLNVYRIRKSSTKLLEKLLNVTDDIYDFETVVVCFEDHPELLHALRKEKFLYEPKQEKPVFSEYSLFNESMSLNKLTLVNSQKCNLRCSYCYLSDSLHEENCMSFETGRSAIDFLFEHSNGPVFISFYGGEPLLNFKVLKNCTEYASNRANKESRNVFFDVITNGTIVSESILDFFVKYGFQIGISLDGPKEVHNKFRKYSSGKGTYKNIIDNIVDYFARVSKKIDIRFLVPIHHSNYLIVEELYDYFVNLEEKTGISFQGFGRITYVEDRHGFNESVYFEDYVNMLSKYTQKVYDECVTSESSAPIYDRKRIDVHFIKALDSKERRRFSSVCLSGLENFTVYPNGNIGACRQLDPLLYPKAIWGNITNFATINEYNRVEPYEMSKISNLKCIDCWLRNVCSVSCPGINAYYGKIDTPDKYSCEIAKISFKTSVWLRDRLIKSGFLKNSTKGIPSP